MPTIQEQQAIQAIVAAKNIPYLVHFTRVDNLPSILNNGFYPQSRKMELFGGIPHINDELRIDNKKDHTCFSISFPNSRMFFRVRNTFGGNWAILLINKQILWEKECLFYQTNAASNSVRFNSIDNHKGSHALNTMFLSNDECPRESFLLDCDPTDEQAEVMIPGIIESSYIDGIIFDNNDMATEYSNRIKDKKIYYCQPVTKIYTTRKACRYGY